MTRPTRIEINCTTGEESIIELTDAEIAQRESDAAAYAAAKDIEEAEAKAKAEAKDVLLTRLGLTADEAALLLG